VKAPPIALDKFQLTDVLNYWPNLRTEAVPKLTGAEARMSSVYLSVIPWEDIQAGKAMGSMSIAMLGARLGISDPRRVRELRSNLERSCFSSPRAHGLRSCIERRNRAQSHRCSFVRLLRRPSSNRR